MTVEVGVDVPVEGALAGWANQQSRKAGCRAGGRRRNREGIRFAFYGRTSTTRFQDRVSSCAWQREVAETVVAGRGVITVEFFDSGCSRRVPWSDRPQAAALLEAVQDPDRRFDAVVVGEYERAFYGRQLRSIMPILERHGVQLWLPETDGAVDMSDSTHQALMLLLGAQSQREVLRSRHRVLAAMRAQVCEQGRHLGGRPPYGYRLVDAGPHPNRVHAEWGRRSHRLGPDPKTAPHVRWMFAQRLAEHSVASIARTLNERRVPCPSFVDRERNSHRSGEAWTLRTVAAILANPRYTGHQVWNRQSRDHSDDDDRGRSGTGHDGSERPVQRWNPAEDWAISRRIVHPPLVTQEDFVATQAIRAARANADGRPRTYVLAGLVQCGRCGRRMDAHWVHQRAGYRCRHGRSSARPAGTVPAKTVYIREDRILDELPERLTHVVDSHISSGVDHCQLAPLLRANGIMIICDTNGWALSATASAAPLVG